MKKFLLTLVAVVVSCIAMAVNNMRSESVNGFSTIEGTYNTSAYPGNYLLLDSNGFPMKSDVVGVCLNALPEGYYYQWIPMYGAEDVQIQVMPETRIAYISQKGNTAELDFKVCIINESTGYPEIVRTFKFVYQKDFIGPTGHRID